MPEEVVVYVAMSVLLGLVFASTRPPKERLRAWVAGALAIPGGLALYWALMALSRAVFS